jgi:hypothetical protein
VNKVVATIAVLAALAAISGCDNDAAVASRNLSQAADNFEINRRVVFYNGITGEYVLTIEGLCSLEANHPKIAVTCKTGPGIFKKHYLGVSNNVTWFIEQLEPAPANTYHYRVVFKPSVIVPDVQVKF